MQNAITGGINVITDRTRERGREMMRYGTREVIQYKR